MRIYSVDSIWFRKMCQAHTEKCKMARKIRTLGEKEIYKSLGMLEADTIKQVEIKKRPQKKKARISQKNEKSSQYQTPSSESHQREKYVGYTPVILVTILHVDEGRT